MSKLSMSDRYGKFHHWFRMPKRNWTAVSYILAGDIFQSQSGWCTRTNTVRGSLYLLGRGTTFCSCHALCYISVSKIGKFFFTFLEVFFHDIKSEYIKLPGTVNKLHQVTRPYEWVSLPSACRSVDVVHVKWSSCLVGDYNQAKGKGGYPTLGFQCITNVNWCILGVYGPQFGTVNDKHIVKTDSNVRDTNLVGSRIFVGNITLKDGTSHRREICT